MLPFTLVTSDDDLLLQRAVDDVLANRADGTEVIRHDVDEEGELPDVSTVSLFGDDEVYVLWFRSTPTGNMAKDLQALAASPGSTVVAAIKHGQSVPAAVKKIAKATGNPKAHRQASAPADWDDKAWTRLVTDEFDRVGRKADASAVAAVLRRGGKDTTMVSTTVQTVAATVPKDVATISEDHVDEVVGGLGRQSGFAVADAIVARDPAAAVEAVQGAMMAGDSPVMLNAALMYRLRQLLVLRGGGNGTQAALGRRPLSGGRLSNLQREARNQFGPGELAWAVDRVARLDSDLKGSDLPDHVLMEVAVVELATRNDDLDPLRPTHRTTPTFPTVGTVS